MDDERVLRSLEAAAEWMLDHQGELLLVIGPRAEVTHCAGRDLVEEVERRGGRWGMLHEPGMGWSRLGNDGAAVRFAVATRTELRVLMGVRPDAILFVGDLDPEVQDIARAHLATVHA